MTPAFGSTEGKSPPPKRIPKWRRPLPGAERYRYTWQSNEERCWAIAFAEVYTRAYRGVCPHCERPYIPAPLESVDRFHGGDDHQQYLGNYRCPRTGCWGKSAAFAIGRNTIFLWPIGEDPRHRERIGLPVTQAEVVAFEAESRRELADAQRETADRVESAVAGLESLADDVESAIPEFLRRGRERRKGRPRAPASGLSGTKSPEEAARGL